MGVVVEHIVGKALPRAVGHARDGHFVDPVFALLPTGVPQHGVDVEAAGGILGQVQRLWHIVCPLGGAPGGQLLPQGLVLRDEGVQIHLCLRRGRGCCRGGLPVQQGRVKGAGCVVFAIAAGHEVHEVPQIFQAQRRLFRRDLLAVSVASVVAGLAYVVQPPPQVLVHNVAELLGTQQVDQPIVKGFDQRSVHRIHPFHGKLHRPAAALGADRRVDGIDFFRRHRRLSKGGKLRVGQEKIEVGHGGLPSFRT